VTRVWQQHQLATGAIVFAAIFIITFALIAVIVMRHKIVGRLLVLVTIFLEFRKSKPTASDIGISPKALHEAREIECMLAIVAVVDIAAHQQ
jgi:hypothetical protein